MANRYLYQGVNAAFTRNTGSVVNATTAPAGYNSTYVDSYVVVPTGGGIAIMDFTDGDNNDDYATTGETFWLRFDWYYAGGSFTASAAVLLNNFDQQLFRFRITSSGVMQVQYNSGTLATPAWTQLGSNIMHTEKTRLTYVLSLTIDPAGTAHAYEVFRDNVSQFSGTFSMASLTRVDAVSCRDATTVTGISQVLATVGISLVGSFCMSLKASGAGSNSGMTGVYTDVNEVALNDATVVSSNTAAQRTTFAIGDLPAISGLVVGSEQRHFFRANNNGGAGPQNIKPVIRQSGSDTVGSAVSGMALGFKAFTVKYNLTYTQINTAGFELGWESSA